MFLRIVRRGDGGQSLLEFALILPAFLAILLGALTFILAFQAKIVTTNAARNAGRLVSIQCNEGMPYVANSERLLQRDLSAGALIVTRFAPFKTGGVSPGQWYAQVSCDGSMAKVQLQYAEVDLFPPLQMLLNPKAKDGPMVFPLQVSAEYPAEPAP